jgi:hypothetical protein
MNVLWRGWWIGFLWSNGQWVKCCVEPDADECKRSLREAARKLGALNVHATVTHGQPPGWTPEPGREMTATLLALVRVEGED